MKTRHYQVDTQSIDDIVLDGQKRHVHENTIKFGVAGKEDLSVP
jgi:hypothetical protein